MSKKKKHEEHVNHERWLVSYADFITLLFAFFVVMFSVSQVDSKRAGRFQESFSFATGIETDERGYLPRADDLKKAPMAASIIADHPASAPPLQSMCNLCASNDTTLRFPEELAELEKVIKERAELEANLVGIKVLRRGNELVLRLDATALFDSGDDQIRVEALPLLVSIADELRQRPLAIRVEGHTDNVPIVTARFRSNWDLSTGRATTVVVTLARLGGIDPKRLAAVGYSEYQPIASNDTPEGRNENRRVDFVLSTLGLIPVNDKSLQPLGQAAGAYEGAAAAPLPPGAEGGAAEDSDAPLAPPGVGPDAGSSDAGPTSASDATSADSRAGGAADGGVSGSGPAPKPAAAQGSSGPAGGGPSPAAPAKAPASSASSPAGAAPGSAAAPAPAMWSPLEPWWPFIERLASQPAP